MASHKSRAATQVGFQTSLFRSLQRTAVDLGFSDAASLPSFGVAEDIAWLISRLPSDRIHVMLVSDAGER